MRVATYNIHKCRGIDGRTSVERIVAVVGELAADVVCLQEVVDAPGVKPEFDQAGEIARQLPEYAMAFGSNRELYGGRYGNMTLTRLALRGWRNHDVTHRREERGVLQTDIELNGGTVLHVFNVHLGTGLRERRSQGRRLLSEEVLGQTELSGPRLVLGDFNEWTRGLTTKLMRTAFSTFQPQHAGRFPKTYPGLLPLLTLDHCYFEAPLELEETRLWRSRRALVASDHLPLIADFRIGARREEAA